MQSGTLEKAALKTNETTTQTQIFPGSTATSIDTSQNEMAEILAKEATFANLLECSKGFELLQLCEKVIAYRKNYPQHFIHRENKENVKPQTDLAMNYFYLAAAQLLNLKIEEAMQTYRVFIFCIESLQTSLGADTWKRVALQHRQISELWRDFETDTSKPHQILALEYCIAAIDQIEIKNDTVATQIYLNAHKALLELFSNTSNNTKLITRCSLLVNALDESKPDHSHIKLKALHPILKDCKAISLPTDIIDKINEHNRKMLERSRATLTPQSEVYSVQKNSLTTIIEKSILQIRQQLTIANPQHEDLKFLMEKLDHLCVFWLDDLLNKQCLYFLFELFENLENYSKKYTPILIAKLLTVLKKFAYRKNLAYGDGFHGVFLKLIAYCQSNKNLSQELKESLICLSAFELALGQSHFNRDIVGLEYTFLQLKRKIGIADPLSVERSYHGLSHSDILYLENFFPQTRKELTIIKGHCEYWISKYTYECRFDDLLNYLFYLTQIINRHQTVFAPHIIDSVIPGLAAIPQEYLEENSAWWQIQRVYLSISDYFKERKKHSSNFNEIQARMINLVMAARIVKQNLTQTPPALADLQIFANELEVKIQSLLKSNIVNYQPVQATSSHTFRNTPIMTTMLISVRNMILTHADNHMSVNSNLVMLANAYAYLLMTLTLHSVIADTQPYEDTLNNILERIDLSACSAEDLRILSQSHFKLRYLPNIETRVTHFYKAVYTLALINSPTQLDTNIIKIILEYATKYILNENKKIGLSLIIKWISIANTCNAITASMLVCEIAEALATLGSSTESETLESSKMAYQELLRICDLHSNAFSNEQHIVLNHYHTFMHPAFVSSTVEFTPKPTLLTIVETFKQKNVDITAQQIKELNTYLLQVSHKDAHGKYIQSENGLLSVDVKTVYRQIKKSKPTVVPAIYQINPADLITMLDNPSIEHGLYQIIHRRYLTSMITTPAPLLSKPTTNEKANSASSKISSATTTPEKSVELTVKKPEKLAKLSLREQREKEYKESTIAKKIAQEMAEAKASALKEETQALKLRQRTEFLAKKTRDKLERQNKEKEQLAKEQKVQEEIALAVTDIQKSCLDQIFLKLWQIRILKSRPSNEALGFNGASSSNTGDTIHSTVKHYALLYNLFRCFQVMKTYKEEFYLHSKQKKELENEQEKNLYIGLRHLRHRIIHRGTEIATYENVVAMATNILNAMPQKFLSGNNRESINLWASALSEEQRKEWICEFGYASARYKLSEHQLTLEETDLYKQLNEFHRDLGEKQQTTTDLELMILENYIPKIQEIIGLIDSKNIGIVAMKAAYGNKVNVFMNSYFFELQALRMLITICGELSQAFHHTSHKELKTFIGYCRKIRNEVGHEVDDYQCDHKPDLQFFTEVRAYLFNLNASKMKNFYHSPIYSQVGMYGQASSTMASAGNLLNASAEPSLSIKPS